MPGCSRLGLMLFPENTMSDFKNAKVLVVGGSSGIGLAASKAFAAAGANVTIASRSQDKVRLATQRLGHGVVGCTLDTRDEQAIEVFFSAGSVWDHVVITAAQTPSGPVRGLSLLDAYEAMNSKFWGAYRVARYLQVRDSGSVTFVSGYLSVRPSKSSVLQGAINAAVEALARGLAIELSPVRVNAVSPGLVATPLWDAVPEDTRLAMYKTAASRLPVRRVGQPEDVAGAILYLAGNKHSTGATVLVDGGGTIC